MHKIICIFFLTFGSLFAQYSANDFALIETTFQRNYNDSLFTTYLNSNDTANVNAALLSVSHSRDTAFIDDIISQDYQEHSRYITFALAQLGESKKSSIYLFEKLNDLKNTNSRPAIFAAIGLTGDSSDAIGLVRNFSPEHGIPTGLVNFTNRGIFDSSFTDYLLKSLDYSTSAQLQFEILYALYRIGPEQRFADRLLKILADTSENSFTESKLYALGSLRKLEFFNSPELANQLIAAHDWRIRVEASKLIVHMDFKSEEMIKHYFTLLDDKNPNVSRTAATALKDIEFSSELMSYVSEFAVNRIVQGNLPANTKGELFISLCALYPERTPELIDDLEEYVDNEFINRSLTYYKSDPNWTFEYLIKQLPGASEKEMLSILQPLINLQNNLLGNDSYSKVIITLLRSDYPSTISLVADGLDSLFIWNNSPILQQIVFEQSFKYMNDPEYIESIMSLVNLSGKISEVFESTIIDLISSTGLSSLQVFIHSNYGIEFPSQPDNKAVLDTIISKSFLYNYAVIITEKGSIKIKFLPQFAPVSVGNFCKLAEENYFNKVLFHRVVPNFVIQTGDPTGTGWGGPGYEIVSEFSPLNFSRGTVGMASAGFDTEGSQWFVMHSNYPHLNGRYSVFARVTEGLETVDIIDQRDRIISVELIK